MTKERASKLVEFKVSECAEWMGQLVVEAGGCLHIAQFKDGRFVLPLGRRVHTLRGVTRAWTLA